MKVHLRVLGKFLEEEYKRTRKQETHLIKLVQEIFSIEIIVGTGRRL